MPKLGSINFQLINRMKSMTHFGESKHQAKSLNIADAQKNNIKINSTKVDGIYSYGTFSTYKQTSKEFGGWLKENHPEVKNIDNITRQQVSQYLQGRQESCSMWTVDKDKSALNKVLGMDITKKEAGLKPRALKNITRSRTSDSNSNDLKYNPSNYKDQITIAKNTGIRRQSMLSCKPSDFVRDTNGNCTGLNVTEKGGRSRTIPILKEGQGAVTGIVDNAQNGENALFTNYTKMIDNHAFRSEYANGLYKQIQAEKNNPLDHKGKYSTSTLKEVSRALGHNRISVVVNHYLR